MGRLYCVVLLTPDSERQRSFYQERLGLDPARSDQSLTVFALRGASLVVRGGAAKAELRLAITASPLEPRLAAAKARGAAGDATIVTDEIGRHALLTDPEGNGVHLVEPNGELAQGKWPRLSHAIVNASKFDETVAFYREVLGLKLADEDERSVEFDTGETRLTIHDREDPDAPALQADQRVAFAFEDDDFDAWTAELRGRGVTFATAPAETELGPQVEVEDADGWFVVLHGPAPEELPDEDELDAEYGGGDDERGLPRRGGELGGEGGRKFLPASKMARKQAARTGGKTAAPEPERGGFVPRSPRPYSPRPAGPGGPPRPGGFSGPPREGGSRPYPPRSDAPGGPRPGGPSSGGPRPYPPRGDSGPRTGGPRPSGPRPGGPRPGGPRPGGPRPDRDRNE